MAEQPKQAKIATFGVRFESYDDFLVEYTDNLRRGFLMLPGVRNLALEQSDGLIALQRRLKAAFDPKGLLNPDKIFASGRAHGSC